MPTKLSINIGEGVLDVEGEEAFVKEIYKDFKDRVAEKFGQNLEKHPDQRGKPEVDSKSTKKRTPRRKPAAGENNTTSSPVSAYSPKIVKDIDLTGVKDFYNQFVPKNHPEKILVFVKFLQGRKIEPCTTDQVYTCYHVTKVRPPKAFLQGFRDTSGRKFNFINYKSLSSITVTHIGDTWFDHDLKRKEDNK